MSKPFEQVRGSGHARPLAGRRKWGVAPASRLAERLRDEGAASIIPSHPIHSAVPNRREQQSARREWEPVDQEIRRFRDDEGHLWTVREVVPTYDRRGRAALVFSNEATLTMRRVQDYPSDWASLTDTQLQELSRRR